MWIPTLIWSYVEYQEKPIWNWQKLLFNLSIDTQAWVNIIDPDQKMQHLIRGEMIHQIYGALRLSGDDSVHDYFSPSFDTARFTPV